MATKKSKYTFYLPHTMIWALVLLMPLFVTGPGRPILNWPEYVRFLIVPISFMVVFYINYLLLIDRMLTQHKIGTYILINIVLILGAMILTHLIFQAIHPAEMRPPKPRPLADTLMFNARNMFMYTLVVGASVALKMTGRWYKAESDRKELEHRKAEAELQNLKSQINPHFLFNTLNNIYSLIQIDSDKAQTAVHNLSHLLRYVLYGSTREFVPMSDEVQFMHEYVDLMRLRLPRHVQVEADFPDNPRSMIAPLLLITLIENAFKHGVSNDSPSFIKIHVTEHDGLVECETLNSHFPKSSSDQSGSGIGISNMIRRLEMIYPGAYTYNAHLEGDTYRAFLSIKITQ